MRDNQPSFANLVRQALFAVGFVLFIFFGYRAALQVSDPTAAQGGMPPVNIRALSK